MKRPIHWHERALASMERNLKTYRKELECAARIVTDTELEIATLREQIRRAKEEGRDGFDKDKFNKSRA